MGDVFVVHVSPSRHSRLRLTAASNEVFESEARSAINSVAGNLSL